MRRSTHRPAIHFGQGKIGVVRCNRGLVGVDHVQSKRSRERISARVFGPNVNPVSGVEFRGGKGNLYEGGLKIPFLVRWPGRIKAGRVSDLIFYQPDVLPTLAELTGATAPDDIDGLSILPEILGEKATGRRPSSPSSPRPSLTRPCPGCAWSN